MFLSRSCIIFEKVCSFIGGGWNDYFYRLCLFSLLIGFLCLRVPYIYGMMGFGVVLIMVIAPIFVALFLSRLLDVGPDSFFCGFVPVGTPLWIAPFVCLAETLSYMVRPAVLLIRPFVNLSIGALGGVSLGFMFFKAGSWVLIFLVLLFFYEVFVALVHWFIVCNILSFSEDH